MAAEGFRHRREGGGGAVYVDGPGVGSGDAEPGAAGERRDPDRESEEPFEVSREKCREPGGEDAGPGCAAQCKSVRGPYTQSESGPLAHYGISGARHLFWSDARQYPRLDGGVLG